MFIIQKTCIIELNVLFIFSFFFKEPLLMLEFIIFVVITFFLGAFAFPQVIGGIQHLGEKKAYLFTMILWAALLLFVGYIAIFKYHQWLAVLIGYGFTLGSALKSGKVF